MTENNTKKSAAGFDARQLAAIRHGKGPALIIAGPGSGKTTVLTNRIKYLTEDLCILPENILVITFTRLAAKEMRDRFLYITGKKDTRVIFGTFHSVFLKIILNSGKYRNLKIAERSDCLKALYHVLTQKYGYDSVNMNLSGEYLDMFGKIKNGAGCDDADTLLLFDLYQAEMERRSLIDFDDMLLLCRKVLEEDPGLLSSLRQKFKYILIDEFQDINRTQYEIVKLLSGSSKNVFAVGDDDQSIYGFRGSDPAFMKTFVNDFRGTRVIYLTSNYRSVKWIVRASEKLIDNNRDRYKKDLHAEGEKGLRPFIRDFQDIKGEAAYIEKCISELKASYLKEGLPVPTFAVLGRTREALEKVSAFLSPDTLKEADINTFHGSKGLEYTCVFIIGANEGITPEKKALSSGNLEEERRAFYVALTRAKKYLHILYTHTLYNRKAECSRFVKEMKVRRFYEWRY